MNEKFKEIRDRIIEQNSESQTLYSMHNTLKRLMSIMYYYEKPMTLDDMAALLGMSKASMSNAVRELIEIGLVKKVWIKGERKDIYKVEEDNYESFIKFFCYNWRKQITPKTSSMTRSIRELKQLAEEDGIDEETKDFIQKDLEKLYDGLDYLSWVSGVIELFETHEIFDYVPKKERKINNR